MGDITLTAAVRNNLLSLQETAKLMSRTQERLATGKKVNSALDNPTNFFTASSLDSRASDLNRLLDSVGNGVQTLKAADAGIKSLTKLVESAQATARSALQAAKGDVTYANTIAGTGVIADDVAATFTGSVALTDTRLDGTVAGLAGNTALNAVALGIANGENLTITRGSQTYSINFTNGGGAGALDPTADDVDDLINSINTFFGGGEVVASIQGGALRLQGEDMLEGITVGGTAAGKLGFGAGNNTAAAAVTAGQTLTFQVGENPLQTVVFGSNAGQVATAAALQTTLDGFTGLNAAYDVSNQLVVTAVNNNENISVGGTARQEIFGVGVTPETADTNTFKPTNATLAGIAGATLTFTVGEGQPKTITIGSGSGQVGTRDALVEELNKISGFTASFTAGNLLSISSTSQYDVSFEGSASAIAAFGLTPKTYEPTVTINAESTTRASLQNDFNYTLKQITQLARDSRYNGVNLLDGDNLTVIFNENGSSKLNIEGVKFDSTGLGIDDASGQDFQQDSKINAVLAKLDTALTTLRSQASKFGSNLSVVETRQSFTKDMINTLQTGAANLTLADTNEEGANLLALQTRQQLSTTALSLSAQADQAVLRLF